MSKLTRQVAIARTQSNDALATRVQEAIAQYEAKGGGGDDVRITAESVSTMAKRCGEFWDDKN